MMKGQLPGLVAIVCIICMPCAGWGQTMVTSGSFLDYQGSVVRPWDSPERRIVVFERLNPANLSGDLYVTVSEDAGKTWSQPAIVVATAANERHAEMVQTGAEEFQLFHLSNATGGFRIHRASSTDGEHFVAHGPLDLGWVASGEINPHVIRLPDGRLLLAYHRLSGAAYLSWSDDNGMTWDSGQTQISPANAALPRMAWRQADQRLILTYQTGSNPVSIWSRTSKDLANWSDIPLQIVADGNNHDAMPLVLDSGDLAVFWARVANGNFQVFSATSENASAWSGPAQHTDRPGLANVQPHPLLIADHRFELYWGAQFGQNNYNILRQIVCLGKPCHRIGGTVSGLAGSGLVLRNNGDDDLAITDDGPFVFASELDEDQDYEVTVFVQPSSPNQTCTVTNGVGTVSGDDMTDIEVDCVTETYTVGGTVVGLRDGSEVVLQNNGGDELTIDANGPFTFATPIEDGADYQVTILAQPTDPLESCGVSQGNGDLAGADVSDVSVDCTVFPAEIFADRFEQE
jgi:hypothetical protein